VVPPMLWEHVVVSQSVPVSSEVLSARHNVTAPVQGSTKTCRLASLNCSSLEQIREGVASSVAGCAGRTHDAESQPDHVD
jgi:hypothetical protein